jgi:hypothetical protein
MTTEPTEREWLEGTHPDAEDDARPHRIPPFPEPTPAEEEDLAKAKARALAALQELTDRLNAALKAQDDTTRVTITIHTNEERL